jgi:hypothetical protein
MAGHGWVNCHPFPLARAGGDHTAKLVPEHERLAQFCITNAGLAEPVQVRATYTDRLHAQQRLAQAGFRLWFFVQAQVVGGVQADNFHEC